MRLHPSISDIQQREVTISQLIKEIRLKIAYKLLMDKKVTKVSVLAAAVGFDNFGYFSRQFLERLGKGLPNFCESPGLCLVTGNSSSS